MPPAANVEIDSEEPPPEKVVYRLAESFDVKAMAAIRSSNSQTEELWRVRISAYLEGTRHPRQALRPRVSYVAVESRAVVGFIAGHLTERYDCSGELQWIDVVEGKRGRGIASELLYHLASWFWEQGALRICVDPTDDRARRFYFRHGAAKLNEHWLVWNDIRSVLASG